MTDADGFPDRWELSRGLIAHLVVFGSSQFACGVSRPVFTFFPLPSHKRCARCERAAAARARRRPAQGTLL